MPGDCCDCGACCFSSSDTYVPVTESDIQRLGERTASAVAEVEGKTYLRMQDGHCAQLEHADGSWICGMYSLRPDACRALNRGSPPCLAERALKLVVARRLSRRLEAETSRKA